MASNDTKAQVGKYFFWSIAALLIASAALKGWALLFDPFVDLRSGYPVWVYASVVLIEFFLAAIIVFRFGAISRVATLAFFVIAGLVALARTVLGFTSCGCAGGIEIHPSIALSLDLAIVVALAYLLNGSLADDLKSCMNSLKIGWPRFGGILVGLAAVAISLFFTQGPSETVSASISNMTIHDDNIAVFEIRIRNNSAIPIRIVGSQKSCRCISMEMPTAQKIAPGETAQSSIKLLMDDSNSRNRIYRANFILNHPEQWKVSVDLPL